MRTRSSGLVLEEFLPPHQGILPGGTYTATIAVPQLFYAQAQADLLSFSITCVASEEGVSGPVSEDVNSMIQTRAGRAFQSARLERFLTAIRDSSNDQFQTAVRNAMSEISAMDITLDDGSQAQGLFASGIRSTNTLLLSRLRELAAMCAHGNSVSDLRAKLASVEQETCRWNPDRVH